MKIVSNIFIRGWNSWSQISLDISTIITYHFYFQGLIFAFFQIFYPQIKILTLLSKFTGKYFVEFFGREEATYYWEEEGRDGRKIAHDALPRE